MEERRYQRLRFLKGERLQHFYALVESSADQEFMPLQERCWFLLRVLNGKALVILEGRGKVDDLWISSTGQVSIIGCVKEKNGLFIGYPSKEGYDWAYQDIVGMQKHLVRGTWGISEEELMCWGGGMKNNSIMDVDARISKDETSQFWVATKGKWKEYPGPGWIFALSGKRGDGLVAVGNYGLTAHWNGRKWTVNNQLFSLSFIQMTSQGEIYGAEYYGGVFKRVQNTWKKISERLGWIAGMVEWKGGVWVGTDRGLYRCKEESVVVEIPNISASLITAGETLMWADTTSIHERDEDGTRSSLSLKEVFAFCVEG